MQKKVFYPGIELLRFLASAVIAFLYHYGILYHSYPYMEIPGMSVLYIYGYLGVELFFMVSGFVMYLSYSEHTAPLSGLKKRVIRIYPAIIILVTQAKSISAVANNKFVAWLGKISFSIYLWNIPIAIWVCFIHELAGRGITADERFFWLHIGFSILLAAITYAFFEKPVNKYFKNLIK